MQRYVGKKPSIRVEDGMFVFQVPCRGDYVETVAPPHAALAAAYEVIRLFEQQFAAGNVVEMAGHR